MAEETLEHRARERQGDERSKNERLQATAPVVATHAPVLVRIDPVSFSGVGGPQQTATAIASAIAVAWGLDRDVRLIEELRPDGQLGVPVDPIEWELRRHAAARRLETLAQRHAETRCRLDHEVLERFPPEELEASGTVLGLIREGGTVAWRDDEATRRFLASGDGALLVVPSQQQVTAPVQYKRIMTPLDGSTRAECALPVALAIAHRHGAELLLVHASQAPGLTGSSALDAEAMALARQLTRRNSQLADDYLAELRARYVDSGVAIRTRLVEPGDARRALIEVARVEQAELLVVAAHGASGHADVPSGSVASYVLENAPVSTLMIGTGGMPCAGSLFKDVADADVRRPGTSSAGT